MAEEDAKKRRIRKTRAEREAEILEVATKIFVHDGCAELSLRRIAKEVGIRLSTVQHYFDSRDAVIDALISNRIQRYLDAHASLREEIQGNGEDKLRAIFSTLLDDNLNIETCRFFTQLWAMGFQSEIYRDQLLKMYVYHREDIADLILLVRPDLDLTNRVQRATMISSMIEGALVHFGAGIPHDSKLVNIREKMLETLIYIARS